MTYDSMEAAILFCGDTLTRGRYGSKITDLCTNTIASYLTLLRLYGHQGALRVKVKGLWRLPSCFALIRSPGGATGQGQRLPTFCADTIASDITLLRLYGHQGALRVKVKGLRRLPSCFALIRSPVRVAFTRRSRVSLYSEG